MSESGSSTTIESTIEIEVPNNPRSDSNSISNATWFLPVLIISLIVMVVFIVISIYCNAKKGKNSLENENDKFWQQRAKRKKSMLQAKSMEDIMAHASPDIVPEARYSGGGMKMDATPTPLDIGDDGHDDGQLQGNTPGCGSGAGDYNYSPQHDDHGNALQLIIGEADEEISSQAAGTNVDTPDGIPRTRRISPYINAVMNNSINSNNMNHHSNNNNSNNNNSNYKGTDTHFINLDNSPAPKVDKSQFNETKGAIYHMRGESEDADVLAIAMAETAPQQVFGEDGDTPDYNPNIHMNHSLDYGAKRISFDDKGHEIEDSSIQIDFENDKEIASRLIRLASITEQRAGFHNNNNNNNHNHNHNNNKYSINDNGDYSDHEIGKARVSFNVPSDHDLQARRMSSHNNYNSNYNSYSQYSVNKIRLPSMSVSQAMQMRSGQNNHNQHHNQNHNQNQNIVNDQIEGSYVIQSPYSTYSQSAIKSVNFPRANESDHETHDGNGNGNGNVDNMDMYSHDRDEDEDPVPDGVTVDDANNKNDNNNMVFGDPKNGMDKGVVYKTEVIEKIGAVRRAIVRAKRAIRETKNESLKEEHSKNVELVLKIINKNSINKTEQFLIVDLYEAVKASKDDELGADFLDTLQTMNLYKNTIPTD